MRLGRWIVALALTGAMSAGCDGNGGGSDAGNGADSGHHDVDSGATGTDGGGPGDSGTTMHDSGGGSCASATLPELGYEDVAPGHDWSGSALVGLVQPPGSDDLYLIDQQGQIIIVHDGSVLPTPFLDISSRLANLSDGNELGLLGLAFHPDYDTNGRFFVYYTAPGPGGTYDYYDRLVEMHRSDDPNVADTTEVATLLEIADPQWNHNGGQLAFGPDGYLYLGIGDGGNGGDFGPGHDRDTGNGQSTAVGLGKIHRFDVDDGDGDFAPDDNPFIGTGGLPTIWAYGLRNPWRFSFDRMTGDLWIGDAGQDDWEEIDFQPASSTGGEDYGWAAYEGTHVYRSELVDLVTDHVPPVLEYNHAPGGGVLDGYAVIGGYVYRGEAIPQLRGWYLFADYVGRSVQAPVAALQYCDGAVVGAQRVPGLSQVLGSITSFGQDNAGELYLVGDSVVRIIAQ